MEVGLVEAVQIQRPAAPLADGTEGDFPEAADLTKRIGDSRGWSDAGRQAFDFREPGLAAQSGDLVAQQCRRNLIRDWNWFPGDRDRHRAIIVVEDVAFGAGGGPLHQHAGAAAEVVDCRFVGGMRPQYLSRRQAPDATADRIPTFV